MNPYVSTHPATAPYYREARVTLPRRQTACGMRHCCARRIVECLGRRRLVCTSTRLAERQRMIEAEANRLAMLNAETPRAGIPTPEAQRSFEIETANQKPFSWGIKRGPFSFVKENGPLLCRGAHAALPSRIVRENINPFDKSPAQTPVGH